MSTLVPRTIDTDRLTLLPLSVEHADEMAEALSDPGLHAFIGGAPAAAQDLRTRYARLVAGSPDPAVAWCNWVIRLRDEACLTGTVQATVTEGDQGRETEISWVVGTPWQRRDIATEAARGLVAWLGEHGVRTVVAHIHPDHTASAAVAAATGLASTGQWHEGEIKWQLAVG
ncbi:GNAT family N-acetyltransferase [Streptomyces sp. I05A-00742]|uniref:GNAT family N-acetyltransferase n=1 Tax=Streptomyces sp. I05A-00742 TaxID=2732853 RepID=UPI0014893880|nr:GNAT family N-acetyltransferase [Streptomyces sp. I05A-00742]